MSTAFSTYHDQVHPHARRVHQPSSPPTSFGRAQGRNAMPAPTLTHKPSENFRYSQFGSSASATPGSSVASLSALRPPPPPPPPAHWRPSSRQAARPPPSRPSCQPTPASDPQSPRSIASSLPSHTSSISRHSQESHSTTDRSDFGMALFEGTSLSEDLQLNQAFVPPASPTRMKRPRPAYHYTPSTIGSPTVPSSDNTRDPPLRSRTPSQPSFNSTGVGGVRPATTVPRSITGTFSSSDSRSGGYDHSISTRDSALSSDFCVPSAAASTPNTELSISAPGPGADGKWLTGVGYDGVQSAQACSFSKATGRSRTSEPAPPRGNENVILMGTARSGHWVNHLVIRTRREHITGRYYVDPNLDVPDYASPLRTNSLTPTYRQVHSNSYSEGAPTLSHTSGGRDSRDLNLSRQKGKQGSQARPWKPGATASETTCHALVDSKSGDIDIKLHVGGMGEEHAKKALIDVRSKTGKVRVKLIELSGGRRVHLDVVTGKGDIEVFLPRSFSGPLHVRSAAGEITLLPRLASTMEVIAARGEDALVMISPAPPTPWTVLSDDDSSSVEVPPVTPIEERAPPGPLYGGQSMGSLTAISETSGPTVSHSNPRTRVGSPSPKPWAKYTASEHDDGRTSRNGRPTSLPFNFNELRPYGANGFGAGAQAWNGDFASIVSAKGNVVVGIVGEDVESGKKGFWKRLIGAFKGKK